MRVIWSRWGWEDFKGGEAHSLGKCVCQPKKRDEGIANGET